MGNRSDCGPQRLEKCPSFELPGEITRGSAKSIRSSRLQSANQVEYKLAVTFVNHHIAKSLQSGGARLIFMITKLLESIDSVPKCELCIKVFQHTGTFLAILAISAQCFADAKLYNFDTANRVEGQYIVILKGKYVPSEKDASGRALLEVNGASLKQIINRIARRYHAHVNHVFDTPHGGFSITVSKLDLRKLTADHRIESIYADGKTKVDVAESSRSIPPPGNKKP